MNIRERIADWITGGKLSRAHDRERGLETLLHGVQANHRASEILRNTWADRAITRADAIRAILTEADRDPSRPSIKRIARIAREALK